VQRNGIERLDFMKVDIQGAECKLLRGGRKTFTTLRPDICMEISYKDLVGFGENAKTLLRQFDDFGYTVRELKSDGTLGPVLKSDTTPEDYDTENVFCSARA
jgi:hypothetical protein